MSFGRWASSTWTGWSEWPLGYVQRRAPSVPRAARGSRAVAGSTTLIPRPAPGASIWEAPTVERGGRPSSASSGVIGDDRGIADNTSVRGAAQGQHRDRDRGQGWGPEGLFRFGRAAGEHHRQDEQRQGRAGPCPIADGGRAVTCYYYSLKCHRAHRRTQRLQHTACRLDCHYLAVDPWTRRYFCADPSRPSRMEGRR